MKPAIHWWSNSPHAPTGYGTQTRAVAWRLADAGYPVSIGDNFVLQQGMNDQTDAGTPVPIYPRGYDGYSQDVIVAHYRDWAAKHPERETLLVTLYDVWVLTNPALAEIPRVVSWVPLDHLTLPPQVGAWLQRPNVRPVAMSQYGQSLMQRHDIDADYIPHTVEPVFRAIPQRDQRMLRQIPDDAFLVMMNAANKGSAPTRKAWTENLLALGYFLKSRPDAYIYLHTEAVTPFGIDIPALAKAAGIPSDRLVFPPAYAYRMGQFTDQHLAEMYSRADVLLAVSMGEGFGIPTIEAQACGTPVIGSDAAATPELIEHGWLVEGQPEWDPAQQAFWFRPFVHSIAARLQDAYDGRALDRKAARVARMKARYGADRVVLQEWRKVLR